MLTEFAFTPSVFDENAHEDKDAWQDQLRELRSAMFPRTSAWPVVVSDLFSGSWSSHIEAYVGQISDHRAKKACRELMTGIQRMLVLRPDCREWPHDDDAQWCREAIAASSVEPIERIVSVPSTKNSSANEFTVVRSLDEVTEAGFWRGIDSDASPKMVIAEQVDLLRKLCLHSQWVAIVNPYGFGNEQDFALQLLTMALNRDPAFGPIHFELHSEDPDVNDTNERAIRRQNVANHMTRRIQPLLCRICTVELYFWPKLLDRILVAGHYTRESSGQKRKAARWGVSMSHVARGNEPNAAPTEWKLLRRERLTDWFMKYADDNALNKPRAIQIKAVS
ncbi:hypothetical protein SH449x_003923 [Pirellulaceae bacterium SH449]